MVYLSVCRAVAYALTHTIRMLRIYAYVRVFGGLSVYLRQKPGVHGMRTKRRLPVDGLLILNYYGRLTVA